MNLTFRAPPDQPAYRIDAAALNNELATALGGWGNGWTASHNASEAIVTLPDTASQATIDLVNTTIAAHVANTAARESAKAAAEVRKTAINGNLAAFAYGGKTLVELKAMDVATFDAWWVANVTTIAQASAVLKMLTRAALQRML